MAAKCIFVAYADHPYSNKLDDKRSRDDDEFSQQVIADLRYLGYTVYHRTNYSAEPDEQIVRSVMSNIETCDCLVAVVKRHSTTVGWEIGIAQANSLPILCLAPPDEYLPIPLTRTITGLARCGVVTLQRYEREGDIYRLAHEFANSVTWSAPLFSYSALND